MFVAELLPKFFLPHQWPRPLMDGASTKTYRSRCTATTNRPHAGPSTVMARTRPQMPPKVPFEKRRRSHQSSRISFAQRARVSGFRASRM